MKRGAEITDRTKVAASFFRSFTFTDEQVQTGGRPEGFGYLWSFRPAHGPLSSNHQPFPNAFDNYLGVRRMGWSRSIFRFERLSCFWLTVSRVGEVSPFEDRAVFDSARPIFPVAWNTLKH
jgi:hypothetical protein